MKKTALILWIVAALFLVSSLPLFTQGNAAAGVCGIVIATILFIVGLRKRGRDEKTEASQAKQSEPAPPPSSKKTFRVYIEKGGKKYHRDKKCSGMKNPEYVPIEYALRNGYTQCKKCSH